MVKEAIPPLLNGPNECQTRLPQQGPLTAYTFAQLLRGEARPNSQRNKPRRCAHPPPALSTDALDSRGPALRLAPCAGPRNLLQCPALPWSSPGHWRETVWRILAYYFPAVLYWRRGRTCWYPPHFFVNLLKVSLSKRITVSDLSHSLLGFC